MGLKMCNTCDTNKDLNDFSGAENKQGRAICKDCRAKKAKKHRADFPDLYRGYEYKKKYKITLEIYNNKLKEQGGVCAICGGTWVRALVVDHNHKCCPGENTCGKCLRSLLCGPCNSGLGSFRESINNLHIAIEYLEKNEGSPWQ